MVGAKVSPSASTSDPKVLTACWAHAAGAIRPAQLYQSIPRAVLCMSTDHLERGAWTRSKCNISETKGFFPSDNDNRPYSPFRQKCCPRGPCRPTGAPSWRTEGRRARCCCIGFAGAPSSVRSPERGEMPPSNGWI